MDNLPRNSDVVSKRISDTIISTMIKNNILFVEKYIDLVDKHFSNKEEKEIVYRELGSIVYSCLEATLKSVLVEINNRCSNHKCTVKECKYRFSKDYEDISKARTMNIMFFLVNSRLLGLVPKDIDKYRYLNEMRNYIHISKNIGSSEESIEIDKNYVYLMLDSYYEIIYQLDLASYYFDNDSICLKEVDEDGYDLTKRQTYNDLSVFYLLKIHPILYKVFTNQPLTREDKRIIKSLNDNRLVNIKEIVDHVCHEIEHHSRRIDKENIKSLLIKQKSYCCNLKGIKI